MFSIEGKKAFITGGTSGIGLATAEHFVKEGCEVVVLGRRDARAAIERIGARFMRVDVTQEEDLVAALDQTVKDIGKLDILFNNAGIENTGPTIDEQDATELRRILEVNVVAVYNGLRHGPTRMNDGSAIINTASIAGLTHLPGYAQYASTKAAVISLTKTAALELAPRGIRVNAICPSSVWSEMLPQDHPEVGIVKTLCPLSRVGEPAEVAALAHFLASPQAAYISGQAISIDGGLTAGFGYGVLEKVMA